MQLANNALIRMRHILCELYGSAAEACLHGIIQRLEAIPHPPAPGDTKLWTEQDIILITYGDQVTAPQQAPLQSLRDFLHDYQLDQLFSIVHLLPCFPYSSDDGFAVVDYDRIDPKLGDWSDLVDLSRSFDLMLDLVLNHCSSQHAWFQNYLAGQAPYDRYFIEVDPHADLSAVVRPRSSPLLSRFETQRGPRHVWTTFSKDQIDLNYANPNVLLAMLDVLLLYVARGARVIRLDAIAYLWKQVGTACIHLPETHLVVQLIRSLLDAVAPGTLVLTETNVPHAENMSYFGDGDEAHVVYQFSLAPLLLDAFLCGDATFLMEWLNALDGDANWSDRTTSLSFTASHDGVGVRPLEGLVPPERLHRLIDSVMERGGSVTTRRESDGRESPYELNITYAAALDEPGGLPADVHARRFLATQAVMLALPGIPAVYFHSLVATSNDVRGVSETGRARAINRRKFDRRELDRILSASGTAPNLVFAAYRHLLAIRRSQPAFHPNAAQRTLPVSDAGVISFLRTDPRSGQHIWVLANTTNRAIEVAMSCCPCMRPTNNLIAETSISPADSHVLLEPWQTVWLSDHSDTAVP